MPDRAGRGRAQRVLVVDDDPVIRLLASQALRAIGFRVEEAEDGSRALQSIDRSPSDLVLLDVEMPGLDGFETCARMRQRDAAREIPVLIATGLTDSETIERAFQAGATDFIQKPLDWQILQHRVRFLMRAHEAFGELRRTLTDLRDSQMRLANAQRLARIGHWEWIPGSSDMLWSEEVYRIFGIEPRPGRSTVQAFLAFVHPDDRELVEKAMRGAACEGSTWSLDHRIISESGQRRIVHQQAEVALDASGTPDRVSGTIQDVTERKRAEERIRHLAYYDSVTALPNRRMMTEHLTRLLERSRPGEEMVGLLYVNIDRFKRINDTLGHGLGDRLLRAVATRLTRSAGGAASGGSAPGGVATVSRLGGDEFGVLVERVRSAEDAAQAARGLLETLRTPFRLDHHELVVTASVGIALYPNDGADAAALLRNANAAMRHAKAAGRELYQFFSESMNERSMRNLRLENALRSALERNELVLHYQPLQCAKTGTITGVEALVRWPSREFGMVSPGEFIPLAEETGLIGPLGEWVLQTACSQNCAWQQAGLPPLRVAVNVSSHQVRKPGMVEAVARALRHSGLHPGHLELEITESALLGDEPSVVETLSGLKQLGVRLTLDDFGTGYSSLSHLVRFPIDWLKVDQAFVRGIGKDPQASAIVAAVVAMAHRLKLGVTAEGVETEEQAEFLRAEGCDHLQGFLFSRPIEASALAPLLRRRKGD